MLQKSSRGNDASDASDADRSTRGVTGLGLGAAASMLVRIILELMDLGGTIAVG